MERIELTPTELKVASLISVGLQEKEVADVQNRSVHTVKSQKRAIYRKLGIMNDRELTTIILCRLFGIDTNLEELRKKVITSLLMGRL